jgi:hypothetical protein
MLKGGIAMIARLPVARHSADIDLAARQSTAAGGLYALQAAAARDLGDHFTFRFDAPRRLVQGIEGVRVAAEARLGPRPFERFGVDLVTATVITAKPEHAAPIIDLGIPGLTRPPYLIYPLADSLADKVMGIIERHAGHPSTRFRDLVDIVLIARSQTIDGGQLSAALNSERRRRGLDLPAEFSVTDPALWADGYATSARSVPGLEERDLAAALPIAKSLLDPVLAGTVGGRWNPDELTWTTAPAP